MFNQNFNNMIIENYNKFVQENGHEPSFADATVKWKDDGTTCDALFKLSCDADENYDDFIFFYVDGIDCLENLIEEGGEDFTIIPESVSFHDMP